MYGLIKKNTVQYLTFPLVDADGDFVSGATITGVFNYWEDGTAPQTSFSALTNAEVEIGSTGVYRVLLTTGETNHGYLAFMFTSGTSKPQLLLFRTTVGDPLDLSVHIPADVWTAGSRALTTPNDYKADVTDMATNTNVDANETKIDALPATGEYDSELTAIQADLDNPTQYMANVAALALEATVAALNNLSSADIQTILETNDLDHLLKVAHPSGDPVADSIMDLIMNKDVSQTFDRAADSLEGLRDRGDVAWITGGGGSGIVIQTIPSIPKNIDLSDTKLVRIALYVLDVSDDLPTVGELTAGTIKIERSADGGTSWSTIRSDVACSKHAGGIYYDEVFSSGNGYASADMIKITFKSQKATISANDFEIADATDGIVFITRMDSGLSGGGPSAGDIADAVWEEPKADHQTSTTFGGKNQLGVPSETLADYKATGFSIPNEYDIVIAALQTDLDNPNQYKATGFSVPNEYDAVLTAIQADLDNPDQYKASVAALALEATVNALNNITAADVWAEATKVITGGALTTPNDYKATGFSVPNEYDAVIAALQADLDNPNQYKADVTLLALETTVQAIKILTDNLPTDTEAEILRLRGLNGEFLIAEYDFTGEDNEILEFWQYDTEGNFNTHNKSTGLIGHWIINTTYVSGKPDVAKSKRLS